MLILDLLGMYFDAVVVFFTNSSLLFRMAMAVLWFVEMLKQVASYMILKSGEYNVEVVKQLIGKCKSTLA